MEETSGIKYLPYTITICIFVGLLVLNLVVNARILLNIRNANAKRCSCGIDIANIKLIISKWDRTLQKHESILDPIIKRKSEYITTKDYETIKEVVTK